MNTGSFVRHKRHMLFLTSAPNFRGGGSADPRDPAFQNPWRNMS